MSGRNQRFCEHYPLLYLILIKEKSVPASILLPKQFMHMRTSSADKISSTFSRTQKKMLYRAYILFVKFCLYWITPPPPTLPLKCQMVNPLAEFTPLWFGLSMYTLHMVKRQPLVQLLQVRQSVNKNRIFQTSIYMLLAKHCYALNFSVRSEEPRNNKDASPPPRDESYPAILCFQFHQRGSSVVSRGGSNLCKTSTVRDTVIHLKYNVDSFCALPSNELILECIAKVRVFYYSQFLIHPKRFPWNYSH